jgi:hypothetical protein
VVFRLGKLRCRPFRHNVRGGRRSPSTSR